MERSIVLFVLIWVAFSLTIARVVDNYVPENYMDEEFHVPQTQNFCALDTTWDPKITTLPGVYVLAVAYAYARAALTGASAQPIVAICAASTLRGMNTMLMGASAVVFLLIIRKTYPSAPSSVVMLKAAVVALFPLHFFYHFVFYTEPASTLFVFLMYLLTLHRRHHWGALAGGLSIVIRQANVVWVAFCFGVAVLDRVQPYIDKDAAIRSAHRGVLADAVHALFYSWRHKRVLADDLWGYVAVVVAFGVFVVKNGSIVVGDHSAHEAIFHVPQVLFFSLFALAFLNFEATSLWAIKDEWAAVRAMPHLTIVRWMLGALWMAYCIFKYTHAHPYLLADNRHYTFYIWRLYTRTPAVKYMLIPAYMWGLRRIWRLLGARTALWRLGFSICVAAALIPIHLLEFRYFIIPYLFVQLNSMQSSRGQMLLDLCIHVALNAGTLYVFCARPFTWADGSVARFMW